MRACPNPATPRPLLPERSKSVFEIVIPAHRAQVPLAALSAKPIQLIRYRFGLPPCQGAPGRGSLIESPISNTL